MNWTPTRDKEKYGVVIYNFSGNNDSCIKLNVGDTVHIMEELGDWYFGYALLNKALRGIFPKSFIHIKECHVNKTRLVEEVTARSPPVTQEVTSVLREWGVLLKKLYVEDSDNFVLLRDTMIELIAFRNKILSGKQTVDELKQLKRRITFGIDRINVKLGLDLVVRDDQGNIINPAITSAVRLYRYHDEAVTQLQKNSESSGNSHSLRQKPHLSWTALITIKNIVIKVPEPSEISLGLFVGDASLGKEKPLSEAFVIPWTDSMYSGHTDLLLNLKCLFTDLRTSTLDESPVWLIGSVVRQGSMVTKEVDTKRTSSAPGKKDVSTDFMRRPFGVVIFDMTAIIKNQKQNVLDGYESKETEYLASFYQCGEKETLDMKKLLSARNENVRDNKIGTHGIWFTLELINGDLKQVRDDNPRYVSLRDVPVALHLGLSDVIMPGDVRNDLYITVLSGEFARGAKPSDRNVEVTVRVFNEKGFLIPGVIHQGCGKEPLNEYRSVTYYHENKPKWMETIKIALPIEEFKKSHVKFTFKHRSTNDVKDKNEKPFAMSFVKLMQDNGTTLNNTEHELIVYKIDSKKWHDNDTDYLKLNWRRHNAEEIVKTWQFGLAPSAKENFLISTTFCSTKLTQNEKLLGLLEWGWSGSKDSSALRTHLDRLRNVNSDELMVFLQDTLDVLFEILMNNSTDEDSDNQVFEALIFVITTATDMNKHEAFRPILDSYIQNNFHATLVYNKLIHVLKDYVNDSEIDQRQETLNKAMKCLQYVFRFIIRSRALFVELHGRGQEEFEKSLQQLLEAMANMMVHTVGTTLTVQAHCLKYITTAVPDIISTFDPVILSEILVKMIDNLDPTRIRKQKLNTINDIIHSELFKIPNCRRVLLPSFINHIQRLLVANEEETDTLVVMRKEKKKEKLEKLLGESNIQEETDKNMAIELNLCVKILGDILDVLYCSDVGGTFEDISLLSSEMLVHILNIIYTMTNENSLNRQFVSVFVSLLRQMNEKHFASYFNKYSSRTDLEQFVINLLMVLKNLNTQPVFPADWAEMILLQNSVIVTVLHQLSSVISERMLEPFEEKVWYDFFLCAIAFITQPSLQLEKFTQSKRIKIVNRYEDMRQKTASDIKSLWFSLGQHKIKFVVTTGVGQSMVGPFLEMTMLPDVDLRKTTIPIFFDMMQCEYYSLKGSGRTAPPDMARNNQKYKGKFNEFESVILEKLDAFVESGHGDDHYRVVFSNIISALCEGHKTMQEPGIKLVNTVSRLMEHLLQYRTIMHSPEHSTETRMTCTVNLLDFYTEINRKELFLRYVYKLADLHLSCDNYTEAAYTLLQHANLLQWTSDPLPQSLKPPKNCCVSHECNEARYHNDLKEILYVKIIDYFAKGQMWEEALKLCKELVVQYEDVSMDYIKLSGLLKRMALFYEHIMNPQKLRPEPEYFRVAYFGRGFPAFLQNKIFVHRGNGFERLADFTSRILDQFPNAELMKKLTLPSRDIKDSLQQFIQISKVDCVLQENRFSSDVAEQIQRYYRANHVDKFTYSRPFHCGQKDPTNEFATLYIEKTTLCISYPLPGILRCFPVVELHTTELTPLENAIETMSNANNEVKELIKKFAHDSSLPLDPLTRKLSGMVDPAVMGGIANYEKAFLGDEYLQEHPQDTEKLADLRQLIVSQVPLLDAALQIHEKRVSKEISDLHQHMKKSFQKMRKHVEDKYGKGTLPPDIDFVHRSLRLQSQLSVSSDTSTARLSHQYDSLEMDSNRDVSSQRDEAKSVNIRQSISRGLSTLSEYSSELMFMGLSGSQSSLSRLSLGPSKGGSTLPRQKSSHHSLGNANGSVPKQSKMEKGLSKILRRESFTSSSSTQWFDRPESQVMINSPIIELSEQLAPERPLRSDIERERHISRPLSFNLSTPSISTTPSPSMGSRESLNNAASTPTGSINEDEAPPPLPLKMRDHDGDLNNTRLSGFLRRSSKQVSSSLSFDEFGEPPAKPPRPDRNIYQDDA